MLPLLIVYLILYLVSISGKKWANKCHHKCGMSLSLPVFDQQYRPWCHFHFIKNERLECEIKVPLGYYSALYQHNT